MTQQPETEGKPVPEWLRARRAAPPMAIPGVPLMRPDIIDVRLPPPRASEGGYAAPCPRPGLPPTQDAPRQPCGLCARLRRLFRWRA